MIKRVDKRGLSDVITNLLLILLVLFAMGVVWVVISNVISQGSEGIGLDQFTLNLEIQSAYVSGSDVIVGVKRNSGEGNLLGIKFSFSNGQQSITIDKTHALGELEAYSFVFTASEIPGIGAGHEVSIAPVYETSGTERTGSVVDTEVISGSVPQGAPVCGDSQCDSPIEDAANCPVDCTGGSGTGICGDGIIQDPNQAGSQEQCDGSNLNGESCSTLGFTEGTLSCSGCVFNTGQCTSIGTPECTDGLDNDGDSDIDISDSGCINSNDDDESNCGDSICEGGENTLSCSADCQVTPASCNGVWNSGSEDVGVECDGTPLPHGCSASCTCAAGFGPNGVGGCRVDPALNSGTINSVWNNIFFDSNNLPKSQNVSNYIGKYTNFSSSPETRCFQITFADYLSSNSISYVRLSNSIGTPNIAAGQGYSIWEANNCGQ